MKIVKSRLLVKLLLVINILLLLIMAALFFGNNFFLQHYYLKQKERELIDIMRTIRLSGFQDEAISSFEQGDIVIHKLQMVYDEDELNERIRESFAEKRLWIKNVWVGRSVTDFLQQGLVYRQYFKQPALKTYYLVVARLYGERLMIIGTPVVDVDDFLAVVNRFYLILGLLSFLLGSLLISLFALKIVGPILKINRTALAISEQEFAGRLEIKTGDELEVLGNSVNLLSERLESSISLLKDELEKKERVEQFRKRLISQISHELKTPISLIRGYSQGLKDNITDDEGRAFYLETIIEESERMAGIIDELLLLSKYERDDIIMEETTFTLHELIAELLSRYEVEIERKRVTVVLSHGDDWTIKADRAKLRVVLDNFISNALSYIYAEGRLVFDLTDSEELRFSIYNEGPAIPEDELDRIWTPFYKVDRSGSRKFGGTGLGLAIAGEILKKHNFSYGVCNSPGGVEFYFICKNSLQSKAF